MRMGKSKVYFRPLTSIRSAANTAGHYQSITRRERFKAPRLFLASNRFCLVLLLGLVLMRRLVLRKARLSNLVKRISAA